MKIYSTWRTGFYCTACDEYLSDKEGFFFCCPKCGNSEDSSIFNTYSVIIRHVDKIIKALGNGQVKLGEAGQKILIPVL